MRKMFAGLVLVAVVLALWLGLFGFNAEDDTAHHTVYLVSPLNNSYTNQNNNTLAFTYNHTGSLAGVVNCTLLLDGTAVNYTAGVSANANTAVYSNQTIAEGTRYWWVNCTNGTATESSVDIGWNFTFTADYTNPTEPTLISPANNTNSSDNTPDLNWTTVTDANFKNYTVQADDDSAFSSPNYIYNTTNISESNYSVTSAWADGKWYWRVIAYDNAGNSNTSGYFVYTVDTTAPTITLDSPRNGSVMRNGTWINLTITDLTSVNASWWSNNSGTTNYTLASPWDISTTGWSEGDKAIDVWANDSFGFLRRNTYMFRIDDTAPYNTTACQDLDIAGGYYTLTQNVSSAGTCFNILANNVTLDGQGYWVNYSQSVTGYGVNIIGRNNVTVKNLNIIQGNSSVSSAHGISLSGGGNSTIINNTINATGGGTYGIFVSISGKNNIANNNVTTGGASGHGITLQSPGTTSNILLNQIVLTSGNPGYGVYLYNSGGNNNITGGSIIAKNSYDYYSRGADNTNNFINTNFTAQRRLYFFDSASWLSYNNETNGNIWLKTNASAQTEVKRILITWSQPQMKWNDTNVSSGITAKYVLNGLSVNSKYAVYNTSK